MAGQIYGDVRLDALGNPPTDSVTRPEPEKGPANSAGPSALMGSEFEGKGYLLEEQDEKKVFKAIDAIVESQEPLAKNREEARKHRAAIRSNIPFSVLDKDEDRNVWKHRLPPGGNQPSPIPNKADDLCRKIVSQVIIDLPQPDPKPATDSEQDRAAADLAKRFLKVDGDESGTNDAELFRDILDSSQTDASEFAHLWVDPKGGGWKPRRIKAHPQAQDANNPLVAMQPVMDPMKEIPTADYILRYVTGDGSAEQGNGEFTDDPTMAAKQWLPKHVRDVLGPQHVRTVPDTADIANAEGVVLLMFGPLSDLKRRVPEIATWEDGQLLRLLEWKPRRPKVLVPGAMRNRWKEQQQQKGDVKLDDNALVFWYAKYCRVGPNYSEGAELIVTGAEGGMVLKKATLRTDLPATDGGEARVVLRSVPVSQCKALHDSETRDPFGKAPIDLFGATNEGLANLYGAVQEDTTNRLNPNSFIPSTSPVQGWQLRARDKEPIPIYSKEDQPFYEEFPDLPAFLPSVIDKLETSMQEAAMLGTAAENLNSPQSVSGKAKTIELTQAKTNLAPIAQNFFTFVKRYWRLKLELAQAFLTVPQEVEYVGIDQAYKQQFFTGADFGGVKDVSIMAGTGTLMAPQDKQNFLATAQGQGWIEQDEAAEVGRSAVSDDLGLKASPHEDTIKRELAAWTKGPPDETWVQMAQAHAQEQQQMQAMAQQAQAQGQQPQQMQPQTQAPSTPFLPRPTDDDPAVAKRQYAILRDFIASTDWSKHPPEWRALIDARYLKARQAAGIVSVAEQQAAAQQQQQMQSQEKDKDREFKRGEGEANRQAKASTQGIAA